MDHLLHVTPGSHTPGTQRAPLTTGNHHPKPNPASQGLEDQSWRPREGWVDPPTNPVPGLTWGKSGKWRFFLRCLTAPPHQSSKTCRFAFPLYCGGREGAQWGSSSSIPSQAAACPLTCSFQGKACLVRLSLGWVLAWLERWPLENQPSTSCPSFCGGTEGQTGWVMRASTSCACGMSLCICGEALAQKMPRKSVAVPSLEKFKATLDSAWSNLG